MQYNKSLVTICLLSVLIGGSIASFSGCDNIRDNRRKKMGVPLATYSTMAFFGSPSWPGFVKFTTGKYRGFAEIYVEFPDGSRHFLPEITESVVAKHLDKIVSVMPNDPETRYGDGLSDFDFKNGKLQDIGLKAGFVTWKLAAKEEGPYFELPISKTDLVKLFGEPDSWDVFVPLSGP